MQKHISYSEEYRAGSGGKKLTMDKEQKHLDIWKPANV